MPLPTYIQHHLRQYDNSEMNWGEINNSHLLDNLAHDVWSHNDVSYVLSHQFSTDMREFASRMYTPAQLQSYPAPLPDRMCRNAISCLRRRIRSGHFTI